MITTLRQGMATLFIAVATITLLSAPARADVATDLQALNTQATALQSYLEGVQLNADSTPLCGPLVQADNMARDMVNSITAVDESLAAPLQLDADVLGGIEGLSNTTLSLANEALRLSVDLQSLSTAVDMITLKDALAAMLQLSTDIGSMADRIGEMADNILVMSDNIGLMADRILLTQELQNRNVELTINSILQTQTNTLALVSVVEDSSYDVDFARLISEGELLAARMSAVAFSPWTLDDQLAAVRDDVKVFLAELQSVQDALVNDSTMNTLDISYDALIQLGNLSLMLTSLAGAVDGYVIAIEGLQAFTSSATLADAMHSMLMMSADIGILSNTILQMADNILVMSDNIGMQADQIVLTQQTMNLNVATTQTAILGAQQMAIGIIAARNL
jgi:hypothetical protein